MELISHLRDALCLIFSFSSSETTFLSKATDDCFHLELLSLSILAKVGVSICIIFAPIMLIFRATSLKYCYLHVLNFYLDNGVMTTPKRRILSFVFTVLPFKKSLLIIHEEMAKNKNAYFLQEKCILK